jgi:hypothetical protein
MRGGGDFESQHRTCRLDYYRRHGIHPSCYRPVVLYVGANDFAIWNNTIVTNLQDRGQSPGFIDVRTLSLAALALLQLAVNKFHR